MHIKWLTRGLYLHKVYIQVKDLDFYFYFLFFNEGKPSRNSGCYLIQGLNHKSQFNLYERVFPLLINGHEK